jgi:hypothetical protein
VVIVSAWSNAVNFTDGLDGLAAGCMAMVTAAYVIITFWQWRNACTNVQTIDKGCYWVRDPLDLALLSAATAGACIGFLWWNAAPAKIFMGDTGSLALGGILAGLSVTTRTEVLAVVLGALFVSHHRTQGLPDGAIPPPLRTRWVGGDDGDHPILAVDRDLVRSGRGAVLQRVAHHRRRLRCQPPSRRSRQGPACSSRVLG